jgi:hypothetical protein
VLDEGWDRKTWPAALVKEGEALIAQLKSVVSAMRVGNPSVDEEAFDEHLIPDFVSSMKEWLECLRIHKLVATDTEKAIEVQFEDVKYTVIGPAITLLFVTALLKDPDSKAAEELAAVVASAMGTAQPAPGQYL